MRELIAEGKRNNFITFTLKSVLAEDGSGHEHMSSFDYVYKLETVRDWSRVKSDFNSFSQ